MSRPVLGSALFVLVGPVFELVLLPLVLTGLTTGDDLPAAWPLRALGAVLLAAAVAVLADAFVRFAREGEGTPSPLAPPVRPVRGGVYGRMRHPMYAAATAGLAGEALLLRRPILLAAAALYALTMAVLVRYYEEPLLRRRFGEHWRSGGTGPA
ncbi:MAG: isoprenylcysteine carboxyl methyltransferase [Solirubrobacterales bacterium]|jgi:protein-S-isoprenylcysteine O-methyltransferase Ste14|nr:isoprenylcysteine carboxyl methyltransferase [Solirubrobacterales bacterium]